MDDTGRREKDLDLVEEFETVRALTLDGRSVQVPKSKFGGNLEVASDNVLGGIKASPKSEADTNEVKIDPNTGKLYCSPSEVAMATAEKIGGIVADVKTSEETEEVKIDPNTGKAYVKKGKGNPPDEEDITTVSVDGSKVLQFKNRGKDKGMGYVILRSNKTIAEQMIQDNTIYEIRYDFDLNGKTLEVPANCVLKFEGGKLFNGSIKGNYTAIYSIMTQIFDDSFTFSGTFDIEAWYPEWFGAVSGTRDIMSTKAIQAALNASNTNIKNVRLTGRSYYINDTIVMYSYQSLFGQSGSPSHYSNTSIYQTVNKDAIKLTSVDNDVWMISLKNLAIRNNYEGTDMSNSGIYIHGNNNSYSFYHNKIENVSIDHFDKGIFFDGYGDGGFAYNIFNLVGLYYNTIGFHIKATASEDASITKKVWWNFNRWEFCKFMKNRIGGMLVEGTRAQEENIFEQCAFEGNGHNYDLVNLEKYGYGGFAFYAKNSSCLGWTRFYHCYMEFNLPKKDKSVGIEDSGKEYEYGNYVYPNTIEEYAVFVCNKQKLEVSKNLFAYYPYLFRGNTEYSIRFEANDYIVGKPGFKGTSDIAIDSFFYFNHSASSYARYIDIYINESFPRNAASGTIFDYIKNVYKLSDSASTLSWMSHKVYINHPFLKEPIEFAHDKEKDNYYIKSGAMYIDTVNGKDTNIGTSPNNAINSFSQAENVGGYALPSKLIRWILSNSYNKGSRDNYSGIFRHPLHISPLLPEYTYTSKLDKTFYDEVTFENLTLNLGHGNYGEAFIFKGKKDITFKNCTINFNSTLQHLFRADAGTYISLIKCKINATDISGSGSYIDLQNTRYPNVNISLIECTIQEGITIRNNGYLYHSNPCNKAAGDIVLVDNTHYCEFDGTDVINPDGTLYEKYRRISDKSLILGNYITNVVYKDIDLDGETLTLPSDARLEFKGGKFKNGTIVLNRARCMPMGMFPSYYFDIDTMNIQGNYAEGQILYDSSLKKQKLWNGSEWVNLDGTSLS